MTAATSICVTLSTCEWCRNGKKTHLRSPKATLHFLPESLLVLLDSFLEAGQAGRSANPLWQRIFFAGVQRGSHLPSSFFPREVAFASADFACEDRVAAEFCGGTREWIAREAARIAAEAGAERGNEAASCEATETSATEESIKHTATGGYLTSFIFCVGCLLILCVWNDLLLVVIDDFGMGRVYCVISQCGVYRIIVKSKVPSVNTAWFTFRLVYLLFALNNSSQFTIVDRTDLSTVKRSQYNRWMKDYSHWMIPLDISDTSTRVLHQQTNRSSLGNNPGEFQTSRIFNRFKPMTEIPYHNYMNDWLFLFSVSFGR